MSVITPLGPDPPAAPGAPDVAERLKTKLPKTCGGMVFPAQLLFAPGRTGCRM